MSLERGAVININLSQTPNVTAIVFGDGVSDGSWRIVPSGGNLSIQYLSGGVWIEKSAITP